MLQSSHSAERLLQALLVAPEASQHTGLARLHHVLLWQYLSKRNIMALVELTLSRDAPGSTAAGASTDGAVWDDEADRAKESGNGGSGEQCFLLALGVPLMRRALAQARCSLTDSVP